MLESLEVITQPTQEPFDISLVKQFLRITNDNSNDLLYLLATSARSYLERQLRRSFTTQTLRATFIPTKGVYPNATGYVFPQQTIFRLPSPPIQNVPMMVEVETTPSIFTPAEPTSFVIREFPRAVVEIYNTIFNDITFLEFISRSYAPRIRVTYTAGYSDLHMIPQEYTLAIYQMVEQQFLALDGSATVTMDKSVRELRVPHL